MAMKAVGGLVFQCQPTRACGVARTVAGGERLRLSAFRGSSLAPSNIAVSQRRTLFGRMSTAVKAALSPGDQLSDYSDYFRKLKSTSGGMVALSEFKGQRPVVLFFFPKAGTPSCTKEAQTFRDSYEDFKKLGAAVFGISGDTLDAQEDFVKAQGLPYPLLVDANDLLRQAFGIKADLFGALPGRQTFVIDKDGNCVLSYNNQLQAESHVKEALNAVKKL